MKNALSDINSSTLIELKVRKGNRRFRRPKESPNKIKKLSCKNGQKMNNNLKEFINKANSLKSLYTAGPSSLLENIEFLQPCFGRKIIYTKRRRICYQVFSKAFFPQKRC